MTAGGNQWIWKIFKETEIRAYSGLKRERRKKRNEEKERKGKLLGLLVICK